MATKRAKIWKCVNDHQFDIPSYSPGWTEFIDEYMTRHHRDRHLCPECLTPDIDPIGKAPPGFFKKRTYIHNGAKS